MKRSVFSNTSFKDDRWRDPLDTAGVFALVCIGLASLALVALAIRELV